MTRIEELTIVRAYYHDGTIEYYMSETKEMCEKDARKHGRKKRRILVKTEKIKYHELVASNPRDITYYGVNMDISLITRSSEHISVLAA